MSTLGTNWNALSSGLCKGDYTTMVAPKIVQNTRYGLSDEQISYYCPSVFADSKHGSRGDRYTYISTGEILKSLRNDLGLVVTSVMQSGSRIEGKAEYTKHLLRLRKESDLGHYRFQEDTHEIILVNSHDATSSYILYGGVFRMVCTNGLIAGKTHTMMRVRHMGNIIEEVMNGTLALAQQSEAIMDAVARMKDVHFTEAEQLLLAEIAMKVRFGGYSEAKPETPSSVRVVESTLADAPTSSKQVVPYQPRQFNQPRRLADRGDNAYLTMNRIQENLMQGKVRARDEEGKVHSTHRVKGIDTNVILNRALWELTERMMEIKGK